MAMIKRQNVNRLRSYVSGAIASGYSKSRLRNFLIDQGWDSKLVDSELSGVQKETKDKFIPFIALSVIIILAAVMTFSLSSDLTITGALSASGDEWEEQTEIVVNDTISEVIVNIDFGDNKPNECEAGILVLDESSDEVPFDTENEVYSGGKCVETDVVFDNVIYNPEGTGENEISYAVIYGRVDAVSQTISFVSPTPGDNEEVNATSVTIKINLAAAANEAVLEFDGMNYTMTGADQDWEKQLTDLTNNEYDYLVYVSTDSNWSTSEERTVKINYAISQPPANSLPAAPTLVSPSNASEISDLTPTLKWNVPVDANNDSLHFKVQVAENSNFTSNVKIFESNLASQKDQFSGTPPYAQSTASVTFTFEDDLTGNKTYWWRVAARDSEGYGNYSTSRSFSTESEISFSINIDAKDISAGQTQTFNITVSNNCAETISSASGEIKVYSESNQLLVTLPISTSSISPDDDQQVTRNWISSTTNIGTHTAKLNVTVNGITKTDQDSFTVSKANTTIPQTFSIANNTTNTKQTATTGGFGGFIASNVTGTQQAAQQNSFAVSGSGGLMNGLNFSSNINSVNFSRTTLIFALMFVIATVVGFKFYTENVPRKLKHINDAKKVEDPKRNFFKFDN